MRYAILAAVCGIILGAPVIAPAAVMSHAVALQTAVTADEQALETQLVALAQAGDTLGVRNLLAANVRSGRSAMLARVARRVAGLAEQIAATDPDGSAALVNAAVVVASNPLVSATDSSVSTAVGQSAQTIVNTVQTSSPGAAAAIQTTVAVEGNVDLQVGYTTPVTTTSTDTTTTTVTTTTTTTTTDDNTTTPVVTTPVVTTPVIIPTEPVVPTPVTVVNNSQVVTQTNTVVGQNGSVVVVPTTPSQPVIPVIPEPNPNDSGSPT